MFSLLLALLTSVMWFDFSMQIPVFSANNPRENTGPSEFKIRIEFESLTPPKKRRSGNSLNKWLSQHLEGCIERQVLDRRSYQKLRRFVKRYVLPRHLKALLTGAFLRFMKTKVTMVAFEIYGSTFMMRFFFWAAAMAMSLSGCTVLAVADAAGSAVVYGVKSTVNVLDAVTPDLINQKKDK